MPGDGEGAGAYNTVTTQDGGDVTSGVSWATSPERSLEPRLPYDLQLEKDAVYQAMRFRREGREVAMRCMSGLLMFLAPLMAGFQDGDDYGAQPSGMAGLSRKCRVGSC